MALQRFKLQGFKFVDTMKDGEDATFSDDVYGTLELFRAGTDHIIFRNEAGTTTVLRGPEIKTLLLLLTGWNAVPKREFKTFVPAEHPYRPSTREEGGGPWEGGDSLSVDALCVSGAWWSSSYESRVS